MPSRSRGCVLPGPARRSVPPRPKCQTTSTGLQIGSRPSVSRSSASGVPDLPSSSPRPPELDPGDEWPLAAVPSPVIAKILLIEASTTTTKTRSSKPGPIHPTKLFVVLVSVLIANYNYARFLGEAIESVLSQTFPRVETIVVDDGSTNELRRDVIASYGDRIITVFKENSGQTSALNAAFEQSSGDLISFMDADDAFEPNKVERVVAATRRTPRAYLIQHQMQIVDASGKAMHRPFPASVPDGDIRALVAHYRGVVSRTR